MSAAWETVIGLEVHVELSTKTKMFCACTAAFGGEPNTHCCPVCMGLPGTLPTLNREAVRLAIRAALALNCEITSHNRFDRKNYFYPDLPKAYQISQLYLPLAHDGHVAITTPSGETRDIRIHEMHMEEDAGKLIHATDRNESYADYNRCGVPLIEIVSEPDFRTAAEVSAYLEKLCAMFRYADISDCKMQEGSLRADVNISVRPKGESRLGTRTELKNLNSFKAIERAIAYESARQIKVLESGGTITQETRRWDDAAGVSLSMRSKENAQDYRYFPEPDLLPIVFTDADIEAIRATLPELPEAMRQRYINDYGLTEYDAHVLTLDRALAAYFETAAKDAVAPKAVANWIITELNRVLGEKGLTIADCPIAPAHITELVNLVQKNAITGKAAKTVFEVMFEEPEKTPADIVKEKGLAQVSDEGAILEMVDAVIAANPAQVEQYKGGKTNVLQFFVGQLMKQSRGKANPQTAIKLFQERLNG